MKRGSSLDSLYSENFILIVSFILALVVEFIALTLAGSSNHWMVHAPKTASDESRFIETQMIDIPEQAHLVSESPTKDVHVKAETVMSKRPGKGRQAKPEDKAMEESNQTKSVSDSPLPPSHGPVAVYMPSPVIPSYLQNQELNTSVVIEFLVTSLGAVTPRLLSSSGNEELDAIALSTAQKWQFRPAENNHVPTDSKVRLRIVFEVK